ncbi:MAG: hypothetical protein ACREBR_01170 [bacterium]
MASQRVDEFTTDNCSGMCYTGQGFITPKMYVEANCIIRDGNGDSKTRYVQLSDDEKTILHTTKYRHLDVYLVNSYSGRFSHMDSMRKSQIIQCLNGTWSPPGNGKLSHNKIMKYEKLWTSFVMITVDPQPQGSKMNPFLLGLRVDRSTSPYTDNEMIS